MNRKNILQHLLVFSCMLLSFSLGAQTAAPMVKPGRATYAWNEKVTITFSGLPQRDAHSNRYDDVIIVPTGTPDDKFGQGQRVIVSKPEGQVDFSIPRAGAYEARIYLYEKPGVVAARSAPFKVLSVDEGSLDTKPEEALVEIAMRNRNRNKDLMCRAVSEYFRRNLGANHPYYKTMKSLQSMCPATTARPAPAPPAAAYPIRARYQCYRILSTGNEVAEDIYILPGNQYKTMNKTGNYTYDPKTRILAFTSGPLYQPSQKWVGVYTGKGEPTPAGGRTVNAIIEIRKQSDVDAGNRKVLQQCDCAQ